MEIFKYRVLHKYIPPEFMPLISSLLNSHPVSFKIVKPRKTKLGDFKFDPRTKKYQITINGDLNPYAFLITTLHEFAHLINHKDYGFSVSPHGKEWKVCFHKLLQPIIESEQTPDIIKRSLQKSATQIKASSCSDPELSRALATLDAEDGKVMLESLALNTIFLLNGRAFQKGLLRRTRYLCTDLDTGKEYLVNKLSKVEQIHRGE